MKFLLNKSIQITAATTGKHHFFGYYDISPFDSKDEKILAHEVDFIDRMPTGKEPAGIGYFTEKQVFQKLAETTAWNFQQGARLQWLPPDCDQKIIFNDLIDGKFISVILDIETKKKRILPLPIYAIHPSGEFALTLNFARLNWVGAYGYAGIEDIYKSELAPEKDGIYKVDLKTGESKLIISTAFIANSKNSQKIDSPHHLTMTVFNPSGSRFAFLHRYKLPDGGIHTRLFTANPDGTDLFLLSEGNLSHFDWFSDDEIFIWGRNRPILTNLRKHNFFKNPILKPILNFVRRHERGFLRHHIIGDQCLLFKDKKGNIGSIGVNSLTEDGHFTRYKDTDWVLGDNYPDKEHYRDLFLFNLKTNKKIILGRFYSLPAEKVDPSWVLSGMRTDLHPRFSRAGTKVCFDSIHTGKKQVHVLDINDTLKKYDKN